MATVCCSDTLWGTTIRCELVYNNSGLKGMFVEELHHPARFPMANHWGADKNITLQNLVRYATSLFTLPEWFKSNSIMNPADNRSLQKLLRSINPVNCSTSVISIGNEHSAQSSSPSEKASSRWLSCNNRQTYTSKMSMEPHRTGSNNSQSQVAKQHVSRHCANSVYCHHCSESCHASKNCLDVSLHF